MRLLRNVNEARHGGDRLVLADAVVNALAVATGLLIVLRQLRGRGEERA
jgi:hypothetical protein